MIIAHRTCPRQAPENSLAGIIAAAEQGCDAVEIDLRVSLDQQPFLMHDHTMRRTTGHRLPLELTPASLVRRQRLSNGEQVPSLRDAISALGPDLVLAVDVKTPWAIFPLVREVKAQVLQSRVHVWCTSARAAAYAARRLPECEVAYLKTTTTQAEGRAFLRRAVDLGCKAVSAHWPAVDAAFVAEAHSLGLKVYSYHEEYELTAAKLASGLDGLITDYPLEARQQLGLSPS